MGPRSPKHIAIIAVLRSYLSPLFFTVRSGLMWRRHWPTTTARPSQRSPYPVIWGLWVSHCENVGCDSPPLSPAAPQSHEYRTSVFQISQAIALYPPNLPHRSFMRVEGGLKLAYGGHRAIRGYCSSSIANHSFMVHEVSGESGTWGALGQCGVSKGSCANRQINKGEEVVIPLYKIRRLSLKRLEAACWAKVPSRRGRCCLDGTVR